MCFSEVVALGKGIRPFLESQSNMSHLAKWLNLIELHGLKLKIGAYMVYAV